MAGDRARPILTKLGIWGAAAVACLLVHPSFAQQTPAVAPNPPTNPSTGANLTGFFSKLTPYEFWLTVLICALGLIIIVITTVSLRGMQKLRPEDVTRPIIIITVIMAALVLVTAGYSNEQIAPAFGLFGTIVGYILGRMNPHRDSDPDPASGGRLHARDAEIPPRHIK